MKIYITFFSGLGDSLFVAPTIMGLKTIYPDAELTALVPRLRFNEFILKDVLAFDNIICLQRPHEFSLSSILSCIKLFLKLLSDTRKQQPDIMIATSQARLPDQYLLMLFGNIKRRIGPKFWREKRNPYLWILTDIYNDNNRHIYIDHFGSVKLLSSDVNLNDCIEKVSEEIRNKATSFDMKRQSKKMITITPGSGAQEYKRWKFDNFIEIIKYLIDNYDTDIAILGGKNEYDCSLIPDNIIKNDRFHDFTSKLTLPQIIWLFTQTDLIVSNDNGLLHLAEFLNVSTIGIYSMMNWTYASRKFLDNNPKHIVIPSEKKSEAYVNFLSRSLRKKELKKLSKTITDNITIDEVIEQIELKLAKGK